MTPVVPVLYYSSIYTGDTKRALQHYTRSVALSADLGDVTHQANCCYSVGNCYYVLRQFQLSADSLLKYLQLSAQLHNKVNHMINQSVCLFVCLFI